MIQRDLKIGLVLGLVLVAGVIVKLAIDPRLSTEARMMDLNDSIDGLESIDSNNTYQDDVSFHTPFSLDTGNQRTETIQQEETTNEVARQDNVQENPYPALQHTDIPEQQTLPPVQTPAEIPETPANNEVEVIQPPKIFHVVQKDETLSSISRLYYGSPNQWQKIVDANPDVITNPNKIKPGMRLVIP